MSAKYRSVGRRVARIDALEKVTGAARYGVDQSMPGMLHGALVRSSVPHARIRSLRFEAALRMEGVRGIVVASDVPTRRYGSFVKDMEVFASGKVLYVGQPIAAVAAETLEQARRAAAAVEIEYEELPAVFDVEAAMREDAPLLHEDWQDYAAMPALTRDRNVSNRSCLVAGDVEAGFARSAHVVENRFSSNLVHPGYTEPRAALAVWNERGELEVRSNTQLPFEAQATLADIFATTPSQVRVIGTTIGGGFGGKLRLGTDHYAAVLARKTGRPVKMVSSTEEEIATAYSRQPVIVELKTGVAADGTILAHRARVLVDTGATSGSGVGVASSSALQVTGPYRLPNVLVEGFAIYTNKAPTGSFRAPAGPQGNFAMESQMDIVAAKLGIDPLELRLRNALRDGDTAANGQVVKTSSLEKCLRAAAQAIRWDRREADGSGRGKGIACGWWGTTSGSSEVRVKLRADGAVALETGCAEIGTGALTGAAQVLAEALGVELDSISLVSADTGSTPFDHGAQGSRTAFAVGNACLAAAERIRQRALALAAAELKVPEAELSFENGAVTGGQRSLTLARIAAIAEAEGGELCADGAFLAPATPYDAGRARGMVTSVLNSPSFHAHAVDLSVDRETGAVQLHEYVVAQDVGFAINPTYIEGQIEGGATQGIGQALSEEVAYREGLVLNPNLTDYKMPTSMDVPPIRSILIENPSEVGPFGAKGVGEPPVIEPPATLANAIANATGKRLRRLPLTAERIAAAPSETGVAPSEATIAIVVGLHGELRAHFPKRAQFEEMRLPVGASVADALRELGHAREAWLTSVNGVAVNDTHVLGQGDRLELFPFVEGG